MQNPNDFPKTYHGFYRMIIKTFPWYFGLMLACGFISVIINTTINPLTLKWAVKIFENTSDLTTAIQCLVFIISLYIARLLTSLLKSYLIQYRTPFINRYNQYLLYKRIYDNDIAFFINNSAGTISSYANTINKSFAKLTLDFYSAIFGYILSFIFLAGTMATINIYFLVILAVYSIIKITIEIITQKKLNKNLALTIQEESKYVGLRSDSLNNALTVKCFSNTEYENMYIYKGKQSLIKYFQQNIFLSRCQWMPASVLWQILSIIIISLCFVLVSKGELNISNAIFILSSIESINASFSRITMALFDYSKDSAQVKKAYENIIKETIVNDKPNAKKFSDKTASISFENVSFDYGAKKVLHNFNLDIKPGEKVGVVGLSGAGKTTLVNLLLRMYDVKNGSIKINDTDIRDFTQDSLRRNISYVPQESLLFNRTIMENIKYAKPHATKATVITVAKKANIHDFIINQQKGYNTLVGNNGIKLSGGQRQRISIARALLKDAPILILDEATSSLDSENEILIQKSLAHAMHGKTTIAIAHRLATLRNMDRIIVIKNGQIVESGTHTQLIRRRGIFYKLWKMQSFIPD